MKTKTNTNTRKLTTAQNLAKAKTIKLGIDVHADSYRVVRQVDHATPQPAQKFKPQNFLVRARKQPDQAVQIHSCYEAGPLGYGLHRALVALGIRNIVIRPLQRSNSQVRRHSSRPVGKFPAEPLYASLRG